jgi:hypothetical protein
MCTIVDDETKKIVMDPESHYCPLHLSSFMFIRTLGGHSKTTECLVTLLLTCTTYFHIQKLYILSTGYENEQRLFSKTTFTSWSVYWSYNVLCYIVTDFLVGQGYYANCVTFQESKDYIYTAVVACNNTQTFYYSFNEL